LFRQTNEKKFCLRRVKSEEIRRHPVRDVLKSLMKVGDGLWKFIRTERHEELSVISIEMMVKRLRRDEMTEGSGVKDEKNWTKDGALRDTIGRRMFGGEGVVTVNGESAR
jgi:hypothetical protein